MDPLGLMHQFSKQLARKIVSRFEKPKAEPPVAEAPTLGRYREEAWNTPMTEERRYEARHFKKPVQYYAEMHHAAVSLYDNSPCKGDAELIYGCRVHAEWGLIYAGAAAVPYAVKMLHGRVPEEREDGAAILAAVGGDEQVIDSLLQAFEKDYERHADGNADREGLQALDSIIEALGRMKNKKAIPALAKVVRNSAMNNDTRWMAMQNLGRLARRKFDKNSDPMRAAIQWVEEHGF